MALKLREQGRYGHPKPEDFAQCVVCGRMIDKNLTHCLRCRNIRPPGQESSDARPKTTRLRLLLLLALLAIGLFWLAMRFKPSRVETMEEGAVDVPGDSPSASSTTQSAAPPPAAPSPESTAYRIPDDTSPEASARQTRTSPQQPPVQSATSRATSAPHSRPSASDKLTTAKIDCPACKARGRLPFEAPGKGSYTCPVCAGKGSRTRRYLTADWRLCDHCGGMGCLPEKDDLFRTRNRIVKKKCQKCAGRGLLPAKRK
jgi:predicted nucleic acid-binding Zn ribbon protein